MIHETKLTSLDDSEELNGFGFFKDGDKFVKRGENIYYKTEKKTWTGVVLYNIPLEETFVPRLPQELESVMPMNKRQSQPAKLICTDHSRGKELMKDQWKNKYIYKQFTNRKKCHKKEYQEERKTKNMCPVDEQEDECDFIDEYEEYDYEDYESEMDPYHSHYHDLGYYDYAYSYSGESEYDYFS
jgi:hypothetical protein